MNDGRQIEPRPLTIIGAAKRTIVAAAAASLVAATLSAKPLTIGYLQQNVERLEGKVISVRGCSVRASKSEPRMFMLKDRTRDVVMIITTGEIPAVGDCLLVHGVVGKLGGYRCGIHRGGFEAVLREVSRKSVSTMNPK